jgi:hypothetical protein
VFVALGVQHAMFVGCIVMYGLSGSTYFPLYPQNSVTLGRKLLKIKSLSEKVLF